MCENIVDAQCVVATRLLLLFIFNKFSHEKTVKDIISLEARNKFFSDLYKIKCVYPFHYNKLFTVFYSWE